MIHASSIDSLPCTVQSCAIATVNMRNCVLIQIITSMHKFTLYIEHLGHRHRTCRRKCGCDLHREMPKDVADGFIWSWFSWIRFNSDLFKCWSAACKRACDVASHGHLASHRTLNAWFEWFNCMYVRFLACTNSCACVITAVRVTGHILIGSKRVQLTHKHWIVTYMQHMQWMDMAMRQAGMYAIHKP